MPHERLRQQANQLIDNYSLIISRVFPGIVATNEFIKSFNLFFTEYQNYRRLKLAPVAIQEGKISCTSAVAIMGVWYWLQLNLQPTYFIDYIHPLSGQSKTSSHAVVGLPQPDSSLEYYHYTHATALAQADQSDLAGTYSVTGNAAFLADRLKVFPVSATGYLPK